jgi:hypothetical protein
MVKSLSHALQRGEIQLHQVQPAALGCLGPDVGGGPLRLHEVARGADHLGPCAARARAVSTPMPADTPVTSTRFPLGSLPESTSSVVEIAPIGHVTAIFFIN